MPSFSSPTYRVFVRELALHVGLVVAGILLLPVAIYFVGRVVFGAYEGEGYGGFFGALAGRLAEGNLAAWFLVLSPLFVILIVRAVAFGWRALTPSEKH